MSRQPASIFNDVIGPVMRGPSSSHVAAAVRIGRLGRQMVKGRLKKAMVVFDPKGALATTYHGHGSDMGLVGGLLGYEPENEQLPGSLAIAKARGLDVSFRIEAYEAVHPNTYRMTLYSDQGETVFTSSISTGGGMIAFENIDGYPVKIVGDFYETLVFCVDNSTADRVRDILVDQGVAVAYIETAKTDTGVLVNLKAGEGLNPKILERLEGLPGVERVMALSPVLPVLSSKDCQVPFLTAKEMLESNTGGDSLYELALAYESARGNLPASAVFDKMKEIVQLMDHSIESGLKGTEYEDRILGRQSHLITEAGEAQKLLPGNVLNSIISCITAMMEVKSSMGVIVAAPTAGACGGLPGTIIGACRAMGLSLDQGTKAMLAAGMIGVFIAEHATFAAEVGGCQVECGAGSCMAAGGLVELMGGNAQEAVDAAAMALQNVMGLVCDPVGDRVEVPCLGKNVMAGSNAIACANMALAGFDKVIPLDETIDAMYKVGQMLPSALRCTGNGGLSVTPTGIGIFNGLNGQGQHPDSPDK